MNDAELILASREDPRVFRQLYDRRAEELLAFFYRRQRCSCSRGRRRRELGGEDPGGGIARGT